MAVTQASFLLVYSCTDGVLVKKMCVQASEVGVFTQSDLKAALRHAENLAPEGLICDIDGHDDS